MLSTHPPESELIKVWQCQWLERGRLVTEDGEPIEVVYPGRLNDDQGADFRDAVIATRHGLIAGDVDYWASHFDFGRCRRISSPTLLGRGRAAEIVVNVILPFAFAWGQFSGETELGKQASNLYLSYGRLAVNSIERHMLAQLGLSPILFT